MFKLEQRLDDATWHKDGMLLVKTGNLLKSCCGGVVLFHTIQNLSKCFCIDLLIIQYIPWPVNSLFLTSIYIREVLSQNRHA